MSNTQRCGLVAALLVLGMLCAFSWPWQRPTLPRPPHVWYCVTVYSGGTAVFHGRYWNEPLWFSQTSISGGYAGGSILVLPHHVFVSGTIVEGPCNRVAG